ncbi:MAG TPA: protein kinase [Gemmatimonadales bacterium]|nr:protein kinase [Gemmatimonadales bacterium]
MTDLQKLAASLADRYRIERELGAGGMATVYLARDVKHERQVALKVIRADLSAILGGERFLNEIRVTANLQHPHILPLFDSGSADGLLFYVMPYVAGETLRQRLQREKQLPIDDAVRLAREVASALDYAHRQGVIHRDIKPENVLIQDGTALVTDFGIALAVSNAGGSRLTETGLSLGTPHYMSPEQATGDRALDARTDVYSLGAMLYEMLTGDPPFTGSTSQAVIAAVMTEEPRDVATRRPRIAPHVAEAVHKALEKLPADRFPSAAEFARALEGPAATTGRFAAAPARRWTRRRGLPAALGVAGFVVGLVAARALFPPREIREVRTRLTFTGDANAPAVTNDGRWLAYIRGQCRGTGASCDGDVVVQELPRGVPTVVVSGASGISAPTWSPDGANLLIWMRPGGGQAGLYVVPRAGGVARKVAEDATLFDFADNRTAAVTRRGEPVFRLVDINSGQVRGSIVLGNGRWVLNTLSFNPSRPLIALGGFLGSAYYQAIADLRGRILDSLSTSVGGGGWDPDGRHVLIYELGSRSVGRLVRVAVSGSGHFTGRRVEYLGGIRPDQWTGVAITPTGYVVGDAGQTADVWAFAVGGASRRLTHSSSWYTDPAIAPDGGSVAFVKQDAWGSNVYTVPFAGGRERPVTSDSGLRQLLLWLPQQGAISDIVLGGGTQPNAIGQEITALETGLRRAVTTEPGTAIIGWRPDGTALAEQIGGRGLAVVDSTGKTLRSVSLRDTLLPSSGLSLAPDGQEVALAGTISGQTRVAALRLTDGTWRAIAAIPPAPGAHLLLQRWASDGYLYFSRVVGLGQAELWRLAVRGGPLQRYAALPVACSQGTISLSRDARLGACLVYDNRPDLWLVERK